MKIPRYYSCHYKYLVSTFFLLLATGTHGNVGPGAVKSSWEGGSTQNSLVSELKVRAFTLDDVGPGNSETREDKVDTFWLPPDRFCTDNLWDSLNLHMSVGRVLEGLINRLAQNQAVLEKCLLFLRRPSDRSEQSWRSAHRHDEQLVVVLDLSRNQRRAKIEEIQKYVSSTAFLNKTALTFLSILDVFPMPVILKSHSTDAPQYNIEQLGLPPLSPNLIFGIAGDKLFGSLIEGLLDSSRAILSELQTVHALERENFVTVWEKARGSFGTSVWNICLAGRSQNDRIMKYIEKRLTISFSTSSFRRELDTKLMSVLHSIGSKLKQIRRFEGFLDGRLRRRFEVLLANDWDSVLAFELGGLERTSGSVSQYLDTMLAVALTEDLLLQTSRCGVSNSRGTAVNQGTCKMGAYCCRTDTSKFTIIPPYMNSQLFAASLTPLTNRHEICLLEIRSSNQTASKVGIRSSLNLYSKIQGLPYLLYGLRGELNTSRYWEMMSNSTTNGASHQNSYAKIIGLLEMLSIADVSEFLADSSDLTDSSSGPDDDRSMAKEKVRTRSSTSCEWFFFVGDHSNIIITAPWVSLSALTRIVDSQQKFSVIMFKTTTFKADTSSTLLGDQVLLIRNNQAASNWFLNILQQNAHQDHDELADAASSQVAAPSRMHANRKQLIKLRGTLSEKSQRYINSPTPGSRFFVGGENFEVKISPHSEQNSLWSSLWEGGKKILFFLACPWLIDSPRNHGLSSVPDNEAYLNESVLFLSQRIANSIISCDLLVEPAGINRAVFNCPKLVRDPRIQWPAAWLPGDFLARLFNDACLNSLELSAADEKSTNLSEKDELIRRTIMSGGTTEADPVPWTDRVVNTGLLPLGRRADSRISGGSSLDSRVCMSEPWTWSDMRTWDSETAMRKLLHAGLSDRCWDSRNSYLDNVPEYYLLLSLTKHLRDEIITSSNSRVSSIYPNCDQHRDVTLIDLLNPVWLRGPVLLVNTVLIGVLMMLIVKRYFPFCRARSAAKWQNLWRGYSPLRSEVGLQLGTHDDVSISTNDDRIVTYTRNRRSKTVP